MPAMLNKKMVASNLAYELLPGFPGSKRSPWSKAKAA
jgi:hypothetical protein